MPTAGSLPNNAVATAKIANDAVTTAKIANDAVTTAKIANDAVTTAKIANDAVTTAKIANDAVTAQKANFNYAGSPTRGGPASDLNIVHSWHNVTLGGYTAQKAIVFYVGPPEGPADPVWTGTATNGVDKINVNTAMYGYIKKILFVQPGVEYRGIQTGFNCWFYNVPVTTLGDGITSDPAPGYPGDVYLHRSTTNNRTFGNGSYLQEQFKYGHGESNVSYCDVVLSWTIVGVR